MAAWLLRQYKESHAGWTVAGSIVALATVPMLILGEETCGVLAPCGRLRLDRICDFRSERRKVVLLA